LLDLHNTAYSLISEPKLAKKLPTALYEILLSSGLSEICNDATLILRQMSRLQHIGWPGSVAWRNDAALNKAATDTIQFAQNTLKAAKPSNNTQIVKIVLQGANSIRECVAVKNGERPEYELDLRGACDAFLNLATNIEMLLSDLLQQKETVLNALGQEDELSSMLGKMNLAPQL
jgi:hypothetical protein